MSDEKIARIEELLTDIHRRLFYDNGVPSFQTRLSRNEQSISLVLWVGGAVGTALAAAVVKLWLN